MGPHDPTINAVLLLTIMRLFRAGIALVSVAIAPNCAMTQTPQHNVIIFVADGLRYGSVEPDVAPNMSRLKT